MLGGDAVELQAGEAGVEATLGRQRAMVALLNDLAMIHDDDAIGGAHGGKSVSDDDRRAIAHQPVERFLDQSLALRIEGRGRAIGSG